MHATPTHLLLKRLVWCSIGALGALRASADDTERDSRETLSEVVVIATTPLPDGGMRREDIAAPVQTSNSKAIEHSHSLDLSEFMNRMLGSVHVNDVQNNPLQPDITYRGYTASPLLGTPQGIAVYMDGVRLNQAFGDVVSWDLIPQAAIAQITLLPGSNPLFGLNALGGALSIRTKDGFTDPTTSVQARYGSFARRSIELEHGGHADNGLHWFFTGNLYREDGWRDASPSESNQLFGKLGWRNEQTDVSLTAAYADSKLTGNGLQEQRFLATDYASVYTKPDDTDNRSLLLNLGLRHTFSSQLSFSGTAYFRDLKTATYNGDINESSLDQDLYQPNAAEQAALTAAGYTGFPTSGENANNTPFPYWRCIANALMNEEPNGICNGLANRTRTDQQMTGISGQFTFQGKLGQRNNQATIGAALDVSRVDFSQSTQFAYLNPDRGITEVTGPGAFADGTQNSEDAFDARVDLVGHMHTWSMYVSDTLDLSDAWHLTASGRYYRATVETTDLITPGNQAGSLDGDHTFSRFNPAIGLTVTPTPNINAYFGYSESSRAPSAIELGCADPEQPCKLPNAMAGDPPLDQVVASTWELGIRSTTATTLQWNAGVFRTENRNDILFVADDQTGFGYFTNFGKTQRQGVELGISDTLGQFTIGANYTYLEATYQSAETIGGGGNSSNDQAAAGNRGFEGNTAIVPGDRIPLIPAHTFKLFADYAIHKTVALSMDMVAVSSAFARGNENNLHEPDGVYYLGPGETPGYAIFNFGIDYRPLPSLKAFAQINNIFDRQYFTASQLGATAFRNNGSFIARPFAAPVIDGERPVVQATFYSPGAPRAFWIGLQYSFGKARFEQ
jgi:outer membrane receptor protein involved in Fe transport